MQEGRPQLQAGVGGGAATAPKPTPAAVNQSIQGFGRMALKCTDTASDLKIPHDERNTETSGDHDERAASLYVQYKLTTPADSYHSTAIVFFKQIRLGTGSLH